jgi:hypothetical protein
MSARMATLALAGVPAATLLGAYLWLAHDHGTPWLLGVVVHENGRYTLGETVLYGRHFLRELPISGVYAAASAGSFAAYGPSGARVPSRLLRGAALGAAALLVAGACAATARVSGGDVALHELLQAYVRDEEAPVSGAHWRYHLLSTPAYVAATVVLASLLQRATEGRFRAPWPRPRACWLGGALVTLAVLTMLCGLTSEPFLDPRHLGHQARELGTHLLVTLPLSFAVLLALHARGTDPTPPVAVGERPRDALVAAGGGALVLGYLVLGALLCGAAGTVRPGVALSSLVAAHFYEHGLDYVLVVLLAVALGPAGRAR